MVSRESRLATARPVIKLNFIGAKALWKITRNTVPLPISDKARPTIACSIRLRHLISPAGNGSNTTTRRNKLEARHAYALILFIDVSVLGAGLPTCIANFHQSWDTVAPSINLHLLGRARILAADGELTILDCPTFEHGCNSFQPVGGGHADHPDREIEAAGCGGGEDDVGDINVLLPRRRIRLHLHGESPINFVKCARSCPDVETAIHSPHTGEIGHGLIVQGLVYSECGNVGLHCSRRRHSTWPHTGSQRN